MFRAVGLEPSVVLRRGFCALGSIDGPLVHKLPETPAVAAFVFGHPERLPLLHATSSDFVLRDACSVLAADADGLLLARGPYGGRPLYFASEHADRVVVACTRLSPLVATLDSTPELNVARLGALVASVTFDPSATVYAGISRLRSCQVARFSRERTIVSSRLPSASSARQGSIEDFSSELLERVVHAVDRSVGSLAKVTVLASGGLDSSGLVAVLASRAFRVPGFASDVCAVDFGGPGDDRPHLALLSQQYRLRPHRIRPGDAASLVPASFVIDAAPAVWPSGPLLIFAANQARTRGAEATLSGWGGDVLFDGDLGHFAARARAGHWAGAALDAARLQLLWSSSPIDRVRDYVAKPLLLGAVPGSWRESWRRSRVRRSDEWRWAGQTLRSLLCGPLVPPHPEKRSDLATSIEMDEAADERGQHEVAVGIPRLDPYLDAGLIEFMLSLPAHMLLHDHRMRGLYRQAMRGLLPEPLRLRSDKASFEPAIGELFASAAKAPAFQKLRSMEALGDLGLVEPRAYREALTRTIAGGSARGWLETWPALAVEAFVRQSGGRLDAAYARDEAS